MKSASRSRPKRRENSVGNTATRPSNGGTLRSGNPGNKGGGRKPIAFKQECERLVDEVVLAKVGAYLETHRLGKNREEDVNWKWCADYVTGYAKGRPIATVGTEDDDGQPVAFTLTVTRAA